MNKASTTNILVILGVLTVCFAVYYLFTFTDLFATFTSTRDEAELLSMQSRTNVFIERGQTLAGVQFNFALFTNESFQNLEDFYIDIQEQPQGRANPFAPAEPPQASGDSAGDELIVDAGNDVP